MQEIRINIDAEYDVSLHSDALDALARAALGASFIGLSTDPKGVRLFVEDVDGQDITPVIEEIRAYRPPAPEEPPAPPAPSKEDMLMWLDYAQRQLDEFRAVIEKPE